MHRPRVDAFRHRAEAIIADHGAVNHRFRSLGLTSSNADQLSCRAWRATKVIRQGL